MKNIMRNIMKNKMKSIMRNIMSNIMKKMSIYKMNLIENYNINNIIGVYV